MALLRSSLVICFLVFYLQPSQQGPDLTRSDEASIIKHVKEIGPPPKRNDYELFPGIGYYKFHSEEKNMLEAMTICTQEGANLMVINSNDEANVAKIIYARYPDSYSWANIGFSDLDEDGHFETIFGDSLESAGYNNWVPGEPDPSRPSCGVIQRDGLLGGGNCDTRRPFFCEYISHQCVSKCYTWYE